MNLDDATAAAASKLTELERDGGTPLGFLDGRFGIDTVAEHDWCWVFHYQSREYLESGSPLDQVMAGPIVVPKDGGEVFTLGTYAPEDQQLEDYLHRRGPYAARP